MRSKLLKTAAVAGLLFATDLAFAQQQVNLTAGPAGITLPDGNGVPMWGYRCGTLTTGVTSSATCAYLSGPTSAAAVGAIGAISVVNGGTGYTTAPAVTITNATTDTTGAGAKAFATIANGQVVGIQLTSAGTGYTAAPTVAIAAPTSGTTATATAGLAWSPVVITVPTGATGGLQINLTNNLYSSLLTGTATTPVNAIPTSIMIVGQVGGGLGVLAQRTTTLSPDHSNTQGTYTWPIVGGGTGAPPVQGARVQSFGTEAAASLAGSTTSPTVLTWANLRPGTYLLESGTHPSIQVPMGLIGMLVVTCSPTAASGACGTVIANGTAYPAVTATAPAPSFPAVTYNAEIPLEFSEIDPVQNNRVNIAVNTTGFSESANFQMLSQSVVGSVGVINGGSGYTSAPTVSINPASGDTGSGATAVATIGNGQVVSVTVTNVGSGYGATPVVSITGGGGTGATAGAALGANSLAYCGGGAAACYPPAVNYTPFYYLINGVAFNKAGSSASLFPVSPATGVTGTVLARLVNAGLRMHVPSIVGSQTAGFSGTGASATVGGFTLVAEDGNVIPGLLPVTGSTQVAAPKVQTDVFMAAGKTYDVMINAACTAVGSTTCPTTPTALPVYDRQLSLSANSSERDAGMLAYISVNGAGLPAFGAGIAGAPVARDDSYPSVVACSATPCTPVVVSDVSRGVIANDSYIYGVQLASGPTAGTLSCGATPGNAVAGLCANGTFIYTPNVGTSSDSFTYCVNGTTTTTTPPTGGRDCATVTLGASTATSTLAMNGITYAAKVAGYINIAPPGPLAVDKDSKGFPLSVVTSPAPTPSCGTLSVQPNGGFILSGAGSATSCSFTYTAKNTLGTTGTATVVVNFPPPSNLQVKVLDGVQYKACQGDSTCISALTPITDYRWLIEEDKTFYVNPLCTTNTATPPAGCPQPTATTVPPTFALNFHTSHMEYVAQGCTGSAANDQSCEEGQTVLGVPSVCEAGNGVCVPGTQRAAELPSQVTLDPGCGFGTHAATAAMGCLTAAPYPKRYYISVLPGDAANPFAAGYASNPAACTPVSGGSKTCGHGMGGASITWNPALNGGAGGWNPVTIISEPSPYPPGKLSVQVFEDDFPLNGEQDAGGGVDVIATNEAGLGGFEIILFDVRAQFGDATGQMTHDMFNQPLSNSLAGTIDPATGLDACPISPEITANTTGGDGSLQGLTGRIVTCPKYESDGKTLSPLAGEAVVENLMPMQLTVQAFPGADRIARGEEWLQTNTLDGQHPHDGFVKIGEPAYFQEYGPAGFHVSIGFANPKIINARWQGVCHATDPNLQATNCTNTVTGMVTMERLSRPPDQRLYSSGTRDAYSYTQCWVSLGDPDGEDFMFTKCDANGNFTLKGVPSGNWRLTIGDQWNDQIIDGLSTPVGVPTGNNQTIAMGDIPTQQWQSNLYTRTFIDDNKNGVYDSGELGIPFANIVVRYRDGSAANMSVTDLTGQNPFNETFPLFNWYVVETDNTRYKTTGTHTVYDVGGPADGSVSCGNGNPSCGPSGTPYAFLANTYENLPLPGNLSVPGAVYCASPDCSGGESISSTAPNSQGHSSGRIDPPWVFAEGWQGHIGQGNFVEFGKAPYAPTENGGVRGHVVYASTRPFDDPGINVQQPWEPLVPHVTINLYQEGTAPDGVTPTLTLVDTTQTSSWDDWAQGFRSDGIPNMNCPGQGAASGTNADLFYYSIYNQPNYLNLYNYYYNGGVSGGPEDSSTTLTTLPYNSQYKCYDGMHNWNQLQPAPYDGVYQFPSVLGIIPTTTNGTTRNANAGKLNTALKGGVGAPGTSSFVAANMGGTNCTICIPNPDASDPWRVGTPMLPAGKYVVEVILPPGYELVKEEDKNILIGDNFIAPVNQQFGGLADIFILPDQASVASLYEPSGAGYNANNLQNPTQNLGMGATNNFVPGFLEPLGICVGQARIVPDYMSIFPESREVAPFAGATRNLCDRKEVTLTNQMAATAKFYIYTSTHIASKYTGIITDDFTSEFDPFAPTFGEKFSPPNQPVATRDWNGLEISRVYSDQWGAFDGMTYSSWEVNPPNPTGYGPSMFVQCMNDAGPILDTRQTIVNSSGATVANPTYGKMITDPLFNPLYSQFCYENPYLPGLTGYLDTPVVPTAGFVGAGYNNPDCAYPAETPAVSEVDGDGIGPWVSAPNSTGAPHNITIYALGDQVVNNYGYSGPQATTAPFNQKTVTRHYGFGARCTSPSSTSATCNTLSSVTIGGANATIVSWQDMRIVAAVPGSVPNCPVQQQVQYGNPNTTGAAGQTTRCGELIITAGNGRQSIDSVTVTVRGKQPTHVAASGSIQAAIDAAAPGDLIIVDPVTQATLTTPAVAATHRELVIMWKPVRLQGVGAASSIIDASTHPAGELKLDPWRRSVNCLFGLAMNGQPISSSNPYAAPGTTFTCPTPSGPTARGTGPNGNTWNYFYGGPNYPTMVSDRIPLEGILGWDATVNGNLAEQLQEPSIMGAYEGAAITVVAKGVNIPANSTDVFGSGAEATFPAGSTLLTGAVNLNTGAGLVGDANPLCHTSRTAQANPFPGNFICNPSSIDGLGITDSSQGGGAVFLHAWTHYLQIANNRLYNNAGTLSGGLVVGQGEFPEAILAPNSGATAPGSCSDSTITNTQLPYCQQINVNVHNNMVVNNSATGDELFTGTPAGAGGVSICTGSDYYMFNYNWVCGNFSSGDGGGVGHLGFSYNGDIEHNSFVFNQSTNPSIQANGGGLIVMGAAPDATITVNGVATECGSVTDNDCVPGLSDGTGPNLLINANLFQGNSAEAGSGGGLRLQGVNGADVARFPANPQRWYHVTVQNNIIDNNVAGWDGGGVSLEDALAVTLINNTIASNDTTASSGSLFNTLGAPLASSQSPAPTCISHGATVSCPQPAGLVSMQNSPQLTSSFTTGQITCPPGNYAPGTAANGGTGAGGGTCINISYPALYNNIFWQNRSFQIGVGALGTGTQNQQNVVSLFNANFTGTTTGSPPGTQTSTGACPGGSSYWDIGVRNDTGPANHSSGYTLDPLHGVLTPGSSGYSGTNLTSPPRFGSGTSGFGTPTGGQYCNGSRVPPENGGLGWQVPAGIADAVVPNPIFSLTPTATVDEGNNWVNMSWGPLSLLNPVTSNGTANTVLGNYSLQGTSPALNTVPCNVPIAGSCVEPISQSGVTTVTVPATDYFGKPRPDPGTTHHAVDAGAVEVGGH